MDSTQTFIWLAVIGLCAWDYQRYQKYGSEKTFSRAILRIVRAIPSFGLGVAYSLGALAVHLVAPALGPDPTSWLATAGEVVGLAPVAVSLVAFGLHVAGWPDRLKPFLDRHGRWLWLLLVFVAGGLGGLAGAFLVPQHPYAE